MIFIGASKRNHFLAELQLFLVLVWRGDRANQGARTRVVIFLVLWILQVEVEVSSPMELHSAIPLKDEEDFAQLWDHLKTHTSG